MLFYFDMRLRKFVVKTEYAGDSVNFSRFHPQRLRTEVIDPNIGWLDTPGKDKQQKFLRFSGLDERSGSLSKMNRLERAMKWSSNEEQSQMRKSGVSIDMKTVQSHLQQVTQKPPSRPKKMHERLLTLPSGLPSARRRRERVKQMPMEGIRYSKCCEVVDQIYSKIQVLKEIGYSDAKIDFWVLTFCNNRKPFMKQLLMRNINFSLYSLQEEFSYERNSQSVKNKIKFKLRKGKDLLGYLELEEIQEFCSYIEDILIRKNAKKAREVEESITDKLSLGMAVSVQADFLVFTKQDPKQVYNFVSELDNYEQKFGIFQSFSKINKMRFAELNRIEKNLKDTYKDLMEGEAKQIVKAVPSEGQLQLIPSQDL